MNLNFKKLRFIFIWNFFSDIKWNIFKCQILSENIFAIYSNLELLRVSMQVDFTFLQFRAIREQLDGRIFGNVN